MNDAIMTGEEADCVFDRLRELEDVTATEVALSGLVSHVGKYARQPPQLPCPSLR
jgi:hypothetical protein